jgi:hypothetical protein
MVRKFLVHIIFFVLCLPDAKSQEVVTGLQSNPLIKNARVTGTKSLAADTLKLPFFDDFSNHSIFPDPGKWADDHVFINNTYSDRQITTGIATFDALDNSGRLYEAASSTEFEADHLTSLPIDLNLPASVNIWLSFHYLAGGLGDLPEEDDTLALQMFAPAENKWYSAWRGVKNAYPGFRAVILKIDKERFLKKGFRFRFINYASLSPNLNDPSMVGNCDQWHIDYVMLDKNRNAGDTIYPDVAFRYPPRSFLKTHESMPLKQFKQIYLQEMGSELSMHYRNNDTASINVTRDFQIWDVYKNTESFFFTAGARNIGPLTNVDYDTTLFYTFSATNEDSALFRITSWLITDPFDPKDNDTVIYYQRFSNYLAFDDGSAEGGYGINGLGSRNAMVAYRFRSYMQDTLRAVSICFNDSYLNANQRAFDLMVWDDNNGQPGNVLYSREEVMVEQGGGINGFHTYFLPSGVMVNNIFYVGWKQRTETFLNAGFDINTPHGGRQLFWLNGTWSTSQQTGSLMIRPIVGPPVATSVNDIHYKQRNLIHFRPNPASDFIFFDLKDIPDFDLYYISIFDLYGRELIKAPLIDRIDISSLHDGAYIIIISRNGRQYGYNRLIKTK